jgi:hypothetical protein
MRKFYAIDPNDPGTGGTVAPPIANLPTTPISPIVAPAPTAVAPLPINKAAMGTPRDPNLIPLPNYNDPASRNNFARQWTQTYGPSMEGRGDTPLRVNEVPSFANDTSKNLAVKYFGKQGIDPALGYASSMEEGMSGIYKGGHKGGIIDHSENPQYPVDGYKNFGLDTFGGDAKDLIKKGYLPSDFSKNFVPVTRYNEKGDQVISANFKDANSALQAKAAMLKSTYDDIDSYAQQRKITLSPKARDFFALADYNGGPGVGHQMLNDYHNNGYLKDDKFLQQRPTSGAGLKASSYQDIYQNVSRRLLMANALHEQKLFD